MTPYPEKNALTISAIKSWATKFVKGKLKPKDTNFGEIIDVDIKYMMQSLISLTRSSFTEKVYEEG